MKKVFIATLLIVNYVASAETYYVSPTGLNTNDGSFESPWRDWSKAFGTAVAGDTVFFRGGTYPIDVTNGQGIRYDSQNHSGTEDDPICYFNYPGEIPVLDCKNVTMTSALNVAINLRDARYLHFKGLHIRNVNQDPVNAGICEGMYSEYNYHVKYENMVIKNVDGVGFMTSYSYYTEIINCDSYDCCDSLGHAPGAWGSGFGGANELFDDGYTYYYGCRAWNCSDQGFTTGGQRGTVIFDHCWSFDSGLLEDGEGFNFKLGFMVLNPSDHDPHVIMKYCISANGRYGGVTTNDQGYYGQFLYVYNNFFYNNGNYGIFILNPADNKNRRVFRNNLSYVSSKGDYVINDHIHDNNTYDEGIPTVTNDDFVSLDYTQLKAPRKSGGSLPDITFGRLKPESPLVDRGSTLTGLPYYGSAPDIGWAEYEEGSLVITTPSYSSSIIHNKTPDILEIAYVSLLANSVPHPSAFTVTVNSEPRGIVSVEVEGSRIYLTLEEPVKYAEEVFVMYTAPASNPIMSPDGGLAPSFPAMPVTNNVESDDKNPQIIKIYPNPNDGHFTIDFLTPLPGTDNVTIFDYLGKIVFQGLISDSNFDISSSPSGTYTFMVKNGNQIVTAEKFIKR